MKNVSMLEELVFSIWVVDICFLLWKDLLPPRMMYCSHRTFRSMHLTPWRLFAIMLPESFFSQKIFYEEVSFLGKAGDAFIFLGNRSHFLVVLGCECTSTLRSSWCSSWPQFLLGFYRNEKNDTHQNHVGLFVPSHISFGIFQPP